ncbi:terpenoid cyclases/Protein prenyltransferase [Sistotremastrum suecicum HHB10207 ss-3]|uniref:Terpenoid cyclases/Protein prenyltransferase n=1 Tax=Sistotremastrum suecicum HHB10207 ss-3 TaxID=1314776 RepID=A0A166CEG3_9AGAM|nr:terpenoid cyclases/Protein prenyltransferase [Sistotremastrum suecicum HHB10207 ss-3]
MSQASPDELRLHRTGHISHALRCLSGLPGSLTSLDSSRMLIAYYSLSILDLLDGLSEKKKVIEQCREWIWKQFIHSGVGSGFRASPAVCVDENAETPSSIDSPHLIMTYGALLSLAVLRDDYSQLDRSGIKRLLRSAQRPDGSFSGVPNEGESDVRMVYCAFAICTMLDDWSSIDIDKAITFVQHCRTYEGGYSQVPGQEAQGGTTYCALATLYLSPIPARLSPKERVQTIRWLAWNQDSGFRGRTEKPPDACYSFWCGGAMKILNADGYVNVAENARWLSACQFRYGGISKNPTETPDPFHTYLSLASLAVYQPKVPDDGDAGPGFDATWQLPDHDLLINARRETAEWALLHIPDSPRTESD